MAKAASGVTETALDRARENPAIAALMQHHAPLIKVALIAAAKKGKCFADYDMVEFTDGEVLQMVALWFDTEPEWTIPCDVSFIPPRVAREPARVRISFKFNVRIPDMGGGGYVLK